MSISLTLPTTSPEHPAMDYEFLRKEGIRYLERMAGQLWTDFNTHDPGITILEQLCYAVTDLSRRINYDIPDLLASSPDCSADTLYTPARILPSAPVTLDDLRKLVIDVQGVKNAWIEIVEDQTPPLYFDAVDNNLSLQGDELTGASISLKGLYRVLVELSDLVYLDGTGGRDRAFREIARRLHAHRSLCEDIEAIQILDPEYIQIEARIEIDQVDDAETLLLHIYQLVADHISPPVTFRTLSELLAVGKHTDEIFDGPLLDHGFIDPESLRTAQRRTALHTSDLIHIIMDVPGVRAVRTIRISNKSGIRQDWSLELDPSRAAKLDVQASVIQLERNMLPAGVDVNRVCRAHNRKIREAESKLQKAENDLPLPTGRDRKIQQYSSIQRQFPATYGIGPLGLPDSASLHRKAQAQQLKAYLLFFDQLLANYFSQLANAPDLFSCNSDLEPEVLARTYFTSAVDDSELRFDQLRFADIEEHKNRLERITENSSAAESEHRNNFSRRNRFLNHLLARFAEQFTDYALILYQAMPEDSSMVQEKLARDKCLFLQNLPELSRDRGRAFNYLQNTNSSGLEKRLRAKLGLGTHDPDETVYLVEHILLRPMQEDVQQQKPILEEVDSSDPYSLQFSLVFPDWPSRFQDPGFRSFVMRTAREETPAHLSVHILWLDQESLITFTAAYTDWAEKRRKYWQNLLGV